MTRGRQIKTERQLGPGKSTSFCSSSAESLEVFCGLFALLPPRGVQSGGCGVLGSGDLPRVRPIRPYLLPLVSGLMAVWPAPSCESIRGIQRRLCSWRVRVVGPGGLCAADSVSGSGSLLSHTETAWLCGST